MVYSRKTKRRVYSDFIRKLQKVRFRWRVYYGSRVVPKGNPCKVVLESEEDIPDIPVLNSSIPVHITRQKTIMYDNSAKVVLMDSKEFEEYSGKLNLSVVQMELPTTKLPKLVQINLKKLQKANVWYYKDQRVTNWHYDGHDNFLYVLRGVKRVYLAPPRSLPCLNVFSVNNNQSTEFSHKGHFSTIIRRGECLYIPKGWFHKVKSMGRPNIAVNYWGDSLKQIKPYEYDSALRYLIGEISQRQADRMTSQLINKHPAIKEKYQQIMEMPFNKITKHMIESPIEYEMLSRKLQQNTSYEDLSQFWLRIGYDDFNKTRQTTRRKLFMDYLSTMM